MSTANSDLVLRMQAKGGSQVKGELAGTRGEVAKLDTELVAASKRGQRSMGLFSRSAGGLRSAFSGAARGGVGAFSQIENAAKRSTGRITGFIGNATKGLGKLGKAGAVGIGAGVAGFFGVEAIKSSVEGVQTLAEGANVLHNVVGLSEDSAVRLGAVANATGVDNRKLGMSLKTLATTTTSALNGTKSSVKIFKSLGISMDDLRGTGGDTMKVFDLVAQHLDKMRGGVAKTTATAKLFGRGWMTLNPLLEGGGKEMRSLTKFAASLGITLSGNTGKNLAKARDASFRFKLVMMAVQLFIVNKLVPALLQIAGWINKHVLPAFRWLAGAVKDTSKWVQNAASNVGKFITAVAKSKPVQVLADILKTIAGAASAVAQGIWWIIQRVAALASAISGIIPNLHTFTSLLSNLPGIGGGLTQSPGSIPNLTPGTPTGLPGNPVVTGPKGSTTATNQGSTLPPIIKHNVARFNARAHASSGAPVVHVHPFPVHTSIQIGRKELGKAVIMAGAEAKAVR